MNTTIFHGQFTGLARTTADLESITRDADAALWRHVSEALRERRYATGDGIVRVHLDWAPLVARTPEDGPVPFDVQIDDERAKPDVRDAASFVALFFHDAFLMLNLAVPGSFGGVLTLSDDSEIVLSPRMFEYAWVTASRNGSPAIEVLPLPEVIAWYDALQIGTQQVATTDVAKALFILLYLARGEEDESMSVLRLGQAIEALLDVPPAALAQFFELRDAIAHGSAPLLHPLADGALDARVDEESLALVNASDLAASVVVSALQDRIRGQ